MTPRNSILFLLLLFLLVSPLFASESLDDSKLVLLKNDSPLIAFRILFQTGSAQDPAGKEGLAALTASMLAQGGTQKNEYQKILELLFPMAASYSGQTDKEMTVILGVTHKDNVYSYYELLRDAVLMPAFRQEDFERLKTDQLNYTAKTLRFNNDEVLGKEVLHWSIFKKNSYGHPVTGTVSRIPNLTLQDVKDFYRKEYTQKNLRVGVAGDYPADLLEKIRKDFAALPPGSGEEPKIPEPAAIDGLHAVLIEKETPATAISFGFPISFTRSDEDFYAMMIANSWLGQHRSEFSHLYNVMREKRGLNYGDYSYIEHFADGHRFMQPPPNYGRHRQIFQVWIRPVPNATRHFALRQAVREVQMFLDKGMSPEDFELTRKFLLNYDVTLAQSNLEQLGYALDDRFYGLPAPFLEYVKTKFATLKVEDVNSVIRKYLNTKNIIIAAVTQDANTLKKMLVENSPSPIVYESPKPEPILSEDKIIMNYPLPIKEENVTIIPAETIFE